jgi:hypothetical protein
MAATNPNGDQKYWHNGLPFEGVAKSTPEDEGTQKYWFNGLPGESLYPVSGWTQTSFTIQGKSRITVSTSKTIAGKSRVTATGTKTISGQSRVQITSTKTIQGKARVTAATPKTIAGRSRITASTTKTIAGKSRVSITTPKTIQGISRVTAIGSKTISGKANINVISTTTKTVLGKSRVTVSTPITIQGKAKVANFSNGYNYRRTITIDNTKVSGTGDLTDFPFLIAGTYDGTGGEADLRVTGSGGKVTNSSGYDIIFTSDSAGATQLDHEIRYYGSTTGQIAMWVRIPTLDGDADTTIYMWYGNSGVSTSQEDVGGTWETNYKAVWHLGGTGDSSGNSNTLTNSGTVAATGKIYQGSDFEAGDGDYMDSAENGSLDIMGAFTISAWVKFESHTGSVGNIYYKCSTGPWGDATYKTIDFGFSAGAWYVVTAKASGHYMHGVKTFTPSDGTWYYLVGSWDGSTVSNTALKVYLNGSVSGETGGVTGTPNSIQTNNDAARIGGKGRTGSDYLFDGVIEEMRVSTGQRSDDWILTEYNNQNDPSTFYTIGNEETGPSTTKTIAGKARIQSTTSKTIQGHSRITVAASKTILGLAKINIVTPKTVSGKSRITVSTPKTIQGKSKVNIISSKTVQGKSRITVGTTKTVLGQSRITVSASKTISGLSRITDTAVKTIQGRSRITAAGTQTIQGISRIGSTSTQTITGVANIRFPITQSTKNITGKSRITVSALKTITGKASISSNICTPPKFIFVDGKLAMWLFGKWYTAL